ncbi:MAG: hypothetical protein C0511_13900 [Hyphomicrobium sp.]|nr:hypothetical protein [Hyphomicrobium sp.]
MFKPTVALDDGRLAATLRFNPLGRRLEALSSCEGLPQCRSTALLIRSLVSAMAPSSVRCVPLRSRSRWNPMAVRRRPHPVTARVDDMIPVAPGLADLPPGLSALLLARAAVPAALRGPRSSAI